MRHWLGLVRTAGLLAGVSVGLGLQPGFAQTQVTYIPEQAANLRGLDKVTGTATDFEAKVGEPTRFGRLDILVRACFRTPPEEPPEAAAFVEVTELPRGPDARGRQAREPEKDRKVFSGWMMASSPGLNAVDHPVYDVWVISCKISKPVLPPSPPPGADGLTLIPEPATSGEVVEELAPVTGGAGDASEPDSRSEDVSPG